MKVKSFQMALGRNKTGDLQGVVENLFEILSLKILGKLLRSREWSDLQNFGIKITALILSFIAWSRIFKFSAWWRQRAK